MRAIDFLKKLRDGLHVMHSISNSRLWQLLEQGAVVINGKQPKPKEVITFPVNDMYFFPSGKRITLW